MENIADVANGVNFMTVQPEQKMTQGTLHQATASSNHRTVRSSNGKVPSGSSPLKPPKKMRTEDNEIYRCKRRLDFVKLGLNLHRPSPESMSRRNERERKRVKQINLTFEHLRDHLPVTYWGTKNPSKVSKVETLKAAIDYITNLQQLIDEHDAVSATLTPSQDSVMPSPTSSSSEVFRPEEKEERFDGLGSGESELLEFAVWLQ